MHVALHHSLRLQHSWSPNPPFSELRQCCARNRLSSTCCAPILPRGAELGNLISDVSQKQPNGAHKLVAGRFLEQQLSNLPPPWEDLEKRLLSKVWITSAMIGRCKAVYF